MCCLQIVSGEEGWRADGRVPWKGSLLDRRWHPSAMTLHAPLILGSRIRFILLCCLQIASGEEGWRVDGGVNSSWTEDGTKGDDFAGNVELFDFATVHLCKLL